MILDLCFGTCMTIFLFISYLKEESKHEHELKIENLKIHGLNHEY